MNTYPITDTNKNHELQYIRRILHNNIYPMYKLKRKHNPNPIEQNMPLKNKQECATFTYSRKETRIIA
jgi:hypothetical protein